MKITVRDSFDVAHMLPNVPSGHKCGRLHGHTYHITLHVGGPVDPAMGWIVDYADIKTHWKTIHAQIDHTYLNEIEGLSNPTCENIAVWIWDRLQPSVPGLCKIELRETEHCGVEYEGKPL